MAKAAATKKPAAAAAKPAKKSAAAKPAKKPAAAKPAAKAPAPKAPKAPKAAAAEEPAAAAAAGDADVLIVSNKVCNAFKTRAEGLRKAILAAKPAAKVVVDEQKALGRNPDKGTFSVAVKGVTVKACVAMARPFTAMKALDMAALATEVIGKL